MPGIGLLSNWTDSNTKCCQESKEKAGYGRRQQEGLLLGRSLRKAKKWAIPMFLSFLFFISVPLTPKIFLILI